MYILERHQLTELGHAGFIKFHKLFQKLLVMGEGVVALQLHLLFCKIVCHD